MKDNILKVVNVDEAGNEQQAHVCRQLGSTLYDMCNIYAHHISLTVLLGLIINIAIDNGVSKEILIESINESYEMSKKLKEKRWQNGKEK